MNTPQNAHTPLREHRNGAVVTLTLDRPDKHNALDRAGWIALERTFRRLSEDETVRVVVVTGAGEAAFCTGADIAEFDRVRSNAAQAADYGKILHAALRSVRECRHPVVAAINGLCVGGGLELACVCDLRIAADHARFGVPVKKLGLVVAYEELAPLVDLVGGAQALRLLLEGRIVDAAEALRIGLVGQVAAQADFAAAVAESAGLIAEGAPLVARWHKRFVRNLVAKAPLSDADRADNYACFDTEDFQEGRAAFLAKRKPIFKGR